MHLRLSFTSYGKSVKVTPYEIWTNKKPYLSHIIVWGSPTYVKWTMSNQLEAKSNRYLFVGYMMSLKLIYF